MQIFWWRNLQITLRTFTTCERRWRSNILRFGLRICSNVPERETSIIQVGKLCLKCCHQNSHEKAHLWFHLMYNIVGVINALSHTKWSCSSVTCSCPKREERFCTYRLINLISTLKLLIHWSSLEPGRPVQIGVYISTYCRPLYHLNYLKLIR